MSRRTIPALLSAVGLAVLMGFQNCSVMRGTETGDPSAIGTESGDPSLRMRFSGYDQNALWDFILPKAHAAVARVQLCVHQIRLFRDEGGANQGAEFDRGGQLIEWSPSGALIGDFTVAAGTYRRVDIMVRNDCGTGVAIRVENDQGYFQADQPKILRFIGQVTVTSGESGGALTLQTPAFVNFFDTVASDAQLGAGVQMVTGSF